MRNAFVFMMWKCGLTCLNYLDDFGGVENQSSAIFAFCLLRELRELFIRSGIRIEEAVDKACPPVQVGFC
jgi:hypothetical protein